MTRKLDLHRRCGGSVLGLRGRDNGFEYIERDRPVPVYADRCFRVDEPPPTAGHEYLREENRVLREQRGDRLMRLDHHQRRRLAVKAKALGRKVLAEVTSIVTLEPCWLGIGN
jgi:hypothetical protein